MQEVLGDLVYVSVLIYIDDVLVYAKNFGRDEKNLFEIEAIRHIFKAS